MMPRYANLVAALAVSALLVQSLQGAEMNDGVVIMRYGEIYKDGEFDATSWFKSGMYRRRAINKTGNIISDTSMLRADAPSFPDSEEALVDLRAWLVAGLNPVTEGLPMFKKLPPDNYEKILMNPRFDPRPQLVYVASYFIAPDKPVDIYYAYILLEGGKFCVRLERDALTGAILSASRTWGALPEKEEEVLFRQMEVTGRYQLTAAGGGFCPKSGGWSFSGKPESARYYSKGETMYDYKVPGVWQWEGEAQ